VDAGYYDNYGIDVAACWLQENHNWIEQHTSGVLLFQIRDAVSQATCTNLGLEEANRSRAWWQRGFQELTTPPEGAYSALMASMSFRNDEELRMWSSLFNAPRELHCYSPRALGKKQPRLQSEAFYFADSGDLFFVSPVSLAERLSTADGARVDVAGAARGSSMKLLSLGAW
jgi:hypothetical protein